MQPEGEDAAGVVFDKAALGTLKPDQQAERKIPGPRFYFAEFRLRFSVCFRKLLLRFRAWFSAKSLRYFGGNFLMRSRIEFADIVLPVKLVKRVAISGAER